MQKWCQSSGCFIGKGVLGPKNGPRRDQLFKRSTKNCFDIWLRFAWLINIVWYIIQILSCLLVELKVKKLLYTLFEFLTAQELPLSRDNRLNFSFTMIWMFLVRNNSKFMTSLLLPNTIFIIQCYLDAKTTQFLK